MFIIVVKSTNNIYNYMSTYVENNINYALFRRWHLTINANTQMYAQFQDSENFITTTVSNAFYLHNTLMTLYFDFDICEIDSSNNIINETRYFYQPMVSFPQPVDNDIDYDTPGEALKAHKQGKVVDWERKANKKG